MEGEWNGQVSRQKDSGNAELSLDLFLCVTLQMHSSDSQVVSGKVAALACVATRSDSRAELNPWSRVFVCFTPNR